VSEQVIQIAPAPRVLMPLAAICTGMTVKAMQRKIGDGIWREGCEYHRAPDGRIWIDLKGVMQWVERGRG